MHQLYPLAHSGPADTSPFESVSMLASKTGLELAVDEQTLTTVAAHAMAATAALSGLPRMTIGAKPEEGRMWRMASARSRA